MYTFIHIVVNIWSSSWRRHRRRIYIHNRSQHASKLRELCAASPSYGYVRIYILERTTALNMNNMSRIIILYIYVCVCVVLHT